MFLLLPTWRIKPDDNLPGHDTMRSGANLRIRSPLVSFNHVTDPHFVTFFSSLYTTIRNPNPNLNRNATVITNPQIGSTDPQIVTVLIRPADPLRSAPHYVACLTFPAHLLNRCPGILGRNVGRSMNPISQSINIYFIVIHHGCHCQWILM